MEQSLLMFVLTIMLVLIVALLILIERKCLALSQRRLGPSILGRRGLFQILADVIKPLFKLVFDSRLELSATLMFSVFSLLVLQLAIPQFFSFFAGSSLSTVNDLAVYLQFIFTVLSSVCVVALGLLSGSRYAMLGAIRAIISETVAGLLGYIASSVVFAITSSIDYSSIMGPSNAEAVLAMFAIVYAVIGLISAFVTSQRSPMDLIEVEGELVAGYNVEFAGPTILLIYFAEYFHLFAGAAQFFSLFVTNFLNFMELFLIKYGACTDITVHFIDLHEWRGMPYIFTLNAAGVFHAYTALLFKYSPIQIPAFAILTSELDIIVHGDPALQDDGYLTFLSSALFHHKTFGLLCLRSVSGGYNYVYDRFLLEHFLVAIMTLAHPDTWDVSYSNTWDFLTKLDKKSWNKPVADFLMDEWQGTRLFNLRFDAFYGNDRLFLYCSDFYKNLLLDTLVKRTNANSEYTTSIRRYYTK